MMKQNLMSEFEYKQTQKNTRKLTSTKKEKWQILSFLRIHSKEKQNQTNFHLNNCDKQSTEFPRFWAFC